MRNGTLSVRWNWDIADALDDAKIPDNIFNADKVSNWEKAENVKYRRKGIWDYL